MMGPMPSPSMSPTVIAVDESDGDRLHPPEVLLRRRLLHPLLALQLLSQQRLKLRGRFSDLVLHFSALHHALHPRSGVLYMRKRRLLRRVRVVGFECRKDRLVFLM